MKEWKKNGKVGVRSPEGERTRSRSFGQAGVQAEEVEEDECTWAVPISRGRVQNTLHGGKRSDWARVG